MSPAAAATDGRIRELRGLRAGARVPAGRGRHPAVAARAAVPQAHRRGLRRRGGIRRRALRGREAEAPPRNSWGRSPMSSSSTTRGPSTSLMRSSRELEEQAEREQPKKQSYRDPYPRVDTDKEQYLAAPIVQARTMSDGRQVLQVHGRRQPTPPIW